MVRIRAGAAPSTCEYHSSPALMLSATCCRVKWRGTGYVHTPSMCRWIPSRQGSVRTWPTRKTANVRDPPAALLSRLPGTEVRGGGTCEPRTPRRRQPHRSTPREPELHGRTGRNACQTLVVAKGHSQGITSPFVREDGPATNTRTGSSGDSMGTWGRKVSGGTARCHLRQKRSQQLRARRARRAARTRRWPGTGEARTA